MRLRELGHHVEVVSDAEAFTERLAAEPFDWLLLDGDVVHEAGKRFLGAVNVCRRDARIVWLGRRPQHGAVAVTVYFAKPISYAELSRYFSARQSADGREEPGSVGTRAHRERSD